MVCDGTLGTQISTISYIFNIFLGTNPVYGLFIVIISILISTSLGGMHSVVATEIIQFIILMISKPLLLIFSIQETGDISSIIAQIPSEKLDAFNEAGHLGLISLFLSLEKSRVPPYAQRLLMEKI